MKQILLLIFVLFNYFSFSQEADSTLECLEEALKTATSDTSKIKAMLNLGEYELDHNFSKAEDVINGAYAFVQDKKTVLGQNYEALVLVELGVLKRRKGKHTEALSHYLKALGLFEKEKDSANIADVYHNIGMIYKYEKEYSKSMEYFRESIKVNESINNEIGVGITFMLIGSNYKSLRQYDSTEWYYNKSKKIFTVLNDTKNFQRVNNHLVILYLRTGRDALALQLSKDNTSYSKEKGETLNLVSNYLTTSNIYYKSKMYREAGRFVDSALRLAKKEGFKHKVTEGYGKKSKLWSKLKNYKSAYITHKIYKKYSDSIHNTNNVKKIQELELKYVFEKEKLKDSLQFSQEKREIQLVADSESSKKTLYFILLITTLLLSAIIAFLVKRDFKYKKRLLELENKTLLEEKEQITLAFENLKNSANEEERVKAKQDILKLKILTEDDWNHFKNKFELLYPNFFNLLYMSGFQFTKSETRFLILKKLDLETKEIANMTGVSNDSVLKTQYRLRKKLDLSKTTDIINYIEQGVGR